MVDSNAGVSAKLFSFLGHLRWTPKGNKPCWIDLEKCPCCFVNAQLLPCTQECTDLVVVPDVLTTGSKALIFFSRLNLTCCFQTKTTRTCEGLVLNRSASVSFRNLDNIAETSTRRACRRIGVCVCVWQFPYFPLAQNSFQWA